MKGHLILVTLFLFYLYIILDLSEHCGRMLNPGDFFLCICGVPGERAHVFILCG